MTTAQVVETSVTVNNNSPIQDYVRPDDQTQPTFGMFYSICPSGKREQSMSRATINYINCYLHENSIFWCPLIFSQNRSWNIKIGVENVQT